MNAEETIEHLIDTLRTTRDGLNVRMNLANAEVRDEWALLEKQWAQIEARSSRTANAEPGVARDLCLALGQAADEMCVAYRRISKTLD